MSFAQEISKKGNKGFIMLYKSMRCNDFDSDGFLFYKEFEKVI